MYFHRAESPAILGVVEDNQMTFGVVAFMSLRIIECILLFLLTLQVLTSLFVDCAEPEPCVGNVLVRCHPGGFSWWVDCTSKGFLNSWLKAGIKECGLLTRGRKYDAQAIHMEAVQTSSVDFEFHLSF